MQVFNCSAQTAKFYLNDLDCKNSALNKYLKNGDRLWEMEQRFLKNNNSLTLNNMKKKNK